MAEPFHALMRRLLAALLVAGLVSGGLGHGAGAYDGAAKATVTIAGIAVTLCQTDDGAGDDTGKSGLHHDCDQCLMRLAAVLAAPQPVPAPVLFVLAPEERPTVPQRMAGGPAWSAHRARGPPAV